jgi:hypothetical protein
LSIFLRFPAGELLNLTEAYFLSPCSSAAFEAAGDDDGRGEKVSCVCLAVRFFDCPVPAIVAIEYGGYPKGAAISQQDVGNFRLA